MDVKIITVTCLYVLVLCSGQDRPSVRTGLGVINGIATKTTFRGREYSINRFLGIRYAEPPTGELRFQKPVNFGAFSAPLEATNFGSACPQTFSMGQGAGSKNEDCLSLNVFVPTQDTDSANGYAVMVFIHGGGFTVGASSEYPADVLAGHGNVIVVTINYRMGLFGFANTGDWRAPGNLAMWDQRLALQWVHDNIGAFGGDNSRVTIFGNSAGSFSCGMQALYPPNRGLFHNVIAQSGTPQMPSNVAYDNIAGLTAMAQLLGCNVESIDAVHSCLMTANASDIVDALQRAQYDPRYRGLLSFWPTVDGEFFKELPADYMTNTKESTREAVEFFRSLGFITGVNTADGGLLLVIFQRPGQSPEDISVSREEMKAFHIPSKLSQLFPGRNISGPLLAAIEAEYAVWSTEQNVRNMWVKFNSDVQFSVPAVQLSLLHADSQTPKTWLYNFDPRLDTHYLSTPSWLEGANHADELQVVFGFALSGIGMLPNRTQYTPPEWELDLSERMMTAWTNMAKYGNPSSADNPWPQHNSETRQHKNFNTQDSIGQYLYAGEVNFWSKVVPELLDSMESTHTGGSQYLETCG